MTLFADVTTDDTSEPYLQFFALAEVTYNDACLTTKISISETAIEKMAAFAGYTVNSHKKYTFYDTTSVASTLPTATTDLCGEKLLYFQIKSTNTTLLNANNSDLIYFNPPADTTDFGV